MADRNILVDQTKSQDFAPFGDKMTKITKRQIDKSYEIYLALYQGLTGNDEDKDAYKQFSPDFFDLVVIDECHRGSAKEDSAWREVLDYFTSATHLGLTATPKETKDVSNIEYFGEPIYTYSLKQGIEDGFLAPYKVIRPLINIDLDGLKLKEGTIDKYGNEVPNEEFNVKDFDKRIVVDERTELVAKRITQYLKKNNRYDKTIVFCVDIDHANRMRQALVNENPDMVTENPKYVMQITGDNDEGKRELDNFIDPESTYPVIATTSKLLTTGVDAKTCTLNSANIDFIYAQTNDAYGQIRTMNVKNNQEEIIGSWNEDFNYTDEDIEAYLNFAENQGYKHIILAGHSLGANKVIYYLSRHNDKRVEHFFLLSPANIKHLLSVVTQREKDFIQNMYIAGEENSILPFALLGWIECTVKTAYGWIFNNILDNVFVERDGDFSQVEKIQHTGALLIGTYDNFTYGDPKGFLENINNHFPNSDKNKLIFIEKTGHTYQQKQQETAEEILKVLKNWGY